MERFPGGAEVIAQLPEGYIRLPVYVIHNTPDALSRSLQGANHRLYIVCGCPCNI